MTRSSLTYNVSPNGSSGNWYWEVQASGEVVARGLALNHIMARVEAMAAAMSYTEDQQDKVVVVHRIVKTTTPRSSMTEM
jgi:hypothetical protein